MSKTETLKGKEIERGREVEVERWEKRILKIGVSKEKKRRMKKARDRERQYTPRRLKEWTKRSTEIERQREKESLNHLGLNISRLEGVATFE